MATATTAATIGELVQQFIYSKSLLVDRGEFSRHTFVHYRFAADFVQTGVVNERVTQERPSQSS